MNTKNSHAEVAFIIPTLTNYQGLKKVLALLKKFYPESRVVVVNNNGNYLLADKIIVEENVEVINNKKNEGFAKPCNDGARMAKRKFGSRFLVFLNDDVTFVEDWLSDCLFEMKRNGWAATTPVLKDLEGNTENAGYFILPRGKIRLNKNLEKGSSIDGISGTALIFKTSAFFQLGGFDEKFFAYLEDVDLCLRAKKEGYAFGVTTQAEIFHEGQATSSKMKPKKARLDFKNWIFVILKNWARKDLRKYWLQILIERLRNFWGIIKSFT